ncbi:MULTISPECIES: hypothetical protein [Enterobacterales]|uniref:hypothetical protein n=1 Tax=Serratia liquefaciens TaxID=614 RepID=UPI00101EF445|nr:MULTISPECIES: hypothetical protein [Enterobacterales]ELH3997613.1 hypothetical protein [Salmonella enterica]ELK1314893.1 hypothetical protein [Escherichia coli]HDL7632960.1 hypothetical protein [Yersinia enterocolitica]RYM68419.1 hypothetical protein BSR00_23140 [Serratia liquefaciens]RYM77514.1 hypothetical protein BSR01_19725 [Serratia liquefaciens]
MTQEFEFTSSFQFTEKEIKEYIEKNNIKEISDFDIDELLGYVCEKYSIGGWTQELINDDYGEIKDVASSILEEKEED